MAESFGRFLLATRQRSQQTLRALAERAQISPSYLSTLETEKRPAPREPELLNRLADALGVDREEMRARALEARGFVEGVVTFHAALRLELVYCDACGVGFGVPERLMRTRRRTGEPFWCPNGHMQLPHPESEEEDALGSETLSGQLDGDPGGDQAPGGEPL